MRYMIVASLLLWGTAARAEPSVEPYVPNLAGQTVECTAFRHGDDGYWTALKDMPIQRQNEYTTVAAGTVLRAGGPKIVGIDVGGVLDSVCPH